MSKLKARQGTCSYLGSLTDAGSYFFSPAQVSLFVEAHFTALGNAIDHRLSNCP